MESPTGLDSLVGPRVVAALLAIFVIAGCSGDASQAQTEAGRGPNFVLADAPSVRIGGPDDREGYQLSETISAFLLSNREIVIADAMAKSITYYDERGTYLRTVGGSGEGPGEFQRLVSATRLVGDTVAAWDLISRRLTLFPPDGGVPIVSNIGNLALTSLFQHPFYRIASFYSLAMSGGRVAIIPLISPWLADLTPGEAKMGQDTVPLFVSSMSGDEIVQIGAFAGTQWYFFGRGANTIPFYGEKLTYGVGDSVLYVASTGDAVVRGYSSTTGDLVASIELGADRTPLSEQDKREILLSIEQRANQEVADAMPMLSSRPVISDLRVGQDGRVWVQLFRAPTERMETWMVFDPSGNLSASVALDGDYALMDAGEDYALVVATDEFGRQEVRSYELVSVAD